MSATRSRPYHRRQWIVNPSLQFPFVKLLVIVLCGMTVAALAAVYVAAQITLASFQLSKDPIIVSLLQVLFWLVLLELLVITPLVIWVGILLTHKVAGPLVRIQAALAQMSKGSFDIRIKLRKGDMLDDLADAINRLAASQSKR